MDTTTQAQIDELGKFLISTVEGGDWLTAIGYAQAELEAIACGMHNQTPGQLVVQNRLWAVQQHANTILVRAALAAGVDAAAIMAITHREMGASAV